MPIGDFREPNEARRLGVPLAVGLLVLPPLFVWLLLRPGYARSTRIAGFVYAFAMPALYLMVAEFPSA